MNTLQSIEVLQFEINLYLVQLFFSRSFRNGSTDVNEIWYVHLVAIKLGLAKERKYF